MKWERMPSVLSDSIEVPSLQPAFINSVPRIKTRLLTELRLKPGLIQIKEVPAPISFCFSSVSFFPLLCLCSLSNQLTKPCYSIQLAPVPIIEGKKKKNIRKSDKMDSYHSHHHVQMQSQFAEWGFVWGCDRHIRNQLSFLWLLWDREKKMV